MKDKQIKYLLTLKRKFESIRHDQYVFIQKNLDTPSVISQATLQKLFQMINYTLQSIEFKIIDTVNSSQKGSNRRENANNQSNKLEHSYQKDVVDLNEYENRYSSSCCYPREDGSDGPPPLNPLQNLPNLFKPRIQPDSKGKEERSNIQETTRIDEENDLAIYLDVASEQSPILLAESIKVDEKIAPLASYNYPLPCENLYDDQFFFTNESFFRVYPTPLLAQPAASAVDCEQNLLIQKLNSSPIKMDEEENQSIDRYYTSAGVQLVFDDESSENNIGINVEEDEDFPSFFGGNNINSEQILHTDSNPRWQTMTAKKAIETISYSNARLSDLTVKYSLALSAGETDLKKTLLQERNQKNGEGISEFSGEEDNNHEANDSEEENLIGKKVVKKLDFKRDDDIRSYVRGPYNFYSEELKMKAIRDYFKFKDIKRAAEMNEVKVKNLKRWITVGHKRKEGGGRKKEDPEMEELVFQWLQERYLKHNLPATRNEIRQKALSFSNKKEKFKASKGWLEKFFSRYDCKHMSKKDMSHQTHCCDSEQQSPKQ